jgi:RecB family endonuclease NucS
LKLLSTSGFVPRSAMLDALGYKSTYNFRGFGDLHSGLKKLTEDQFKTLRDHFTSSVEIRSLDSKSPVPGHPTEGGGESQAHLSLKEYVAANPSIVLGEPLVETVAVERAFPTGDRADIVMRDQFGRIIGLEIELDIPNGDITGPLQAIKYRRMLEMVSGIRHGEGRAILVAHAIPEDVRNLCDRYEVECFVVKRTDVLAWVAKSNAVLLPHAPDRL